MTLTLPSGTRVELVLGDAPESPRARKPGAPLFSEVLALFDEGVVSIAGKDVRDLTLPDFHVLRAVLMKKRWVAEDEIAFTCANCGADIDARPCEKLEIGPYLDGELDDPELDALDDAAVEIEGLGEISIERRTVRQAEPLFRALARPPFDVTEEVVEAMGIRGATASELAEVDDDAFDDVSDAFLRANYPLRLGAVFFCPKCKARNDVDAPYERELATRARDELAAAATNLPPVEDFAERAHAIADPLLAEIPGEKVELVVDDGTPAVDDGGEPLLGAYLPPYAGDLANPSRPPTVTLYYKTFAAVEADEGPYDWEAELEETIEHELEHHVYYLRGDDPMDAAEREEIAREAVRVLGKKEAARRELGDFASSFGDFFRRAWPLLLIALAAMLLSSSAFDCRN